jgi:hypothetical protein
MRRSTMVKKFILAGIIIGVLGGLGTVFYTLAADINTISPKGHQAIKAKVIHEDPARFTINVKSLVNLGANENAPTFAVYVDQRLPQQCGNFLHLSLKYYKPEKHQRVFNLSKNKEVLDAIKTYRCVVIKNIQY